jgi:hypothetical protein
MEAKQWTVQIFITEDDGDTHARAVLTTRDSSKLAGRGVAHRSPVDRSVPEIGDELAAARALEDLGAKLHEAASHDFAYLAGPAQPRT